jgi:plastocyanin
VPLVLATLLLPSAAQARTHTYTLRYGPVTMGGFNVKFPKAPVRAPQVNGYITHMSARLVDRRGRPITIRDVMLHHFVFHRRGRPRTSGDCSNEGGEPIYGTGEERQQLRLPPGYGYRIHRHDRWRITAMLMSHSVREVRSYIRYRVTVVTGKRLTPVYPFWVRANGCGPSVSYPIEGGGPPGATTTRAFSWRVPFDGRIVAVGGHLHGGAKDMWLSQPRCRNRRLLDTSPRFGMPDDLYYRARPVLHEPGPVDTRYFMSRTGIPVRRGERVRLTADYDDSRPHPRVMAIMHVYIARARDVPRKCTPLPADRRERVKPGPVRTDPPDVSVPLNAVRPNGHTYTVQTPVDGARKLATGSTVDLRNSTFRPGHISVRAGAWVKWRFADPIAHNVLFASGPELIGTPTLRDGALTKSHFRVPGRYELFCYLHPMTMHEVVEVRPPKPVSAARRG